VVFAATVFLQLIVVWITGADFYSSSAFPVTQQKCQSSKGKVLFIRHFYLQQNELSDTQLAPTWLH